MRFLLSAVAATCVTLALFVLMHALIEGMPDAIGRTPVPVAIDAVVATPAEVSVEGALVSVPERIDSPLPPAPTVAVPNVATARPGMPGVVMPDLGVRIDPTRAPSLPAPERVPVTPDTDVVPVLTVAPEYPREAVLQGLRGWVDLEFTIAADGRVADITVVDSAPAGVFDRNARRALGRWQFQPRIVEGKAVARRARIRIAFDAED